MFDRAAGHPIPSALRKAVGERSCSLPWTPDTAVSLLVGRLGRPVRGLLFFILKQSPIHINLPGSQYRLDPRPGRVHYSSILGAHLVEHLAHPGAGIFQDRRDLFSLFGGQAQFICEPLDCRFTPALPLRRFSFRLQSGVKASIDGDAARSTGSECDEKKQCDPESRSA